jgi:hypothetical protein
MGLHMACPSFEGRTFADYICFNKDKNIVNPMLAKVEVPIEKGMKKILNY